MNGDRLKVVLQVRELFERRRLTEQAVADQVVRDAEARREMAEAARDARPLPTGATDVAALVQDRIGGLAMNDAVEGAVQQERLSRRSAEGAHERWIEASKARRSTERLHERRSSEAALLAAKVAQTQLDAVALEGWRRRS
jgi:hypothetical protein